MKKPAPRMIMSDEVGLGKTVEAGLILKELRARGLIKRVRVCVPASLQLQWHRELCRSSTLTIPLAVVVVDAT
jgi:SNF2 family DNA or RNA helicase